MGINQVNPKFKEYNRPLFVAIAVFIPTVASTFLLFTIMLNDCNSMVVTADSLSSLQPLLEGAKCIHGSSRVTALCRQRTLQLLPDAGRSMPCIGLCGIHRAGSYCVH